ncbi:hypothetical protein J4401_06550 [Candidatus Woesearchaeota archaeon]|nr:hypothetical protein [Candidatus Woesearchaeota archaeon]
MEEKILQELGLTGNEAKVYLHLLENGSLSITEITDKVPIHRVNTYDLLRRLLEKGLVSFRIEGKKKYYSATSPEYLLKTLEEKENMLREILPRLQEKQKSGMERHSVNVFQGKKGIKAILEDMLKQKGVISVYGAQGNFAVTLPLYYQQFNRRRTIEKIKMKIIHSEIIREWRRKNPIAFADVRFISRFYDSPSTTFIYGNKIAIVMWTVPPIGIMISSKEISRSYSNFFDILWGISSR